LFWAVKRFGSVCSPGFARLGLGFGERPLVVVVRRASLPWEAHGAFASPVGRGASVPFLALTFGVGVLPLCGATVLPTNLPPFLQGEGADFDVPLGCYLRPLIVVDRSSSIIPTRRRAPRRRGRRGSRGKLWKPRYVGTCNTNHARAFWCVLCPPARLEETKEHACFIKALRGPGADQDKSFPGGRWRAFALSGHYAYFAYGYRTETGLLLLRMTVFAARSCVLCWSSPAARASQVSPWHLEPEGDRRHRDSLLPALGPK